MKKVFINLGLPKTGSTYLQHIFAKNSALYNQHVLIYKDFSNNFSAVNKNRPTNGNAGKIANSLIGNFSLINKSNNPTKVKQDIKIENFQYLDDFFIHWIKIKIITTLFQVNLFLDVRQIL